MAQIDLLKERIPNVFDSEDEYENTLARLLEDTKNIALANLYPFEDWSVIELPIKYSNWQLRACEEIYKALGTAGIRHYAENGLSFTKQTDGLISNTLMSELISKVGTLKKNKNEQNT